MSDVRQIHVWTYGKQCGFANAFGQGPLYEAVELYFECPSGKQFGDISIQLKQCSSAASVDFNHGFIAIGFTFFFLDSFVGAELGGFVVTFVQRSFLYLIFFCWA